MPRNVRNFWIELEVDGSKTPVATGPRSEDGGFRLRVLMREHGSISDKYLIVRGLVEDSGMLTLEVERKGFSSIPNMVATQRFKIER